MSSTWSEAERLRILATYGIMDTAPDEALDEIVQLAASICDVPIALVSLVDETRQWFKAKQGLDARETPRDIAFCHHAIEKDEPIFTVHDARADERFARNPLVAGDPNIAFYAGAPLRVVEGVNLGTLCVIDRKPRKLTEAQEDALAKLAKVVVRYLERRKEMLLREASEAFSRTVLGSIGDAVISTDLDARITYLNAVAESLTGWTIAEAMGRPMAEVLRIVNESTREVVESPVDRVLAQGVTVGLANHTLLIRKDGSEVAIEDSAAPVRVSSGAMSGVVLVFRDATALRAERRKLFDTFMQAPVAIAVLEGPEHTFTFANPHYRALVNGRDVVNKPLFEALPDVRGQGFDELLDQVKRAGQPVHVSEREIRLEHHRGDERLVLDFTYAPIELGGESHAVIATLVDVTKQVDARLAMEAALDRSEFLLSVAKALGASLERREILYRLLETIVPARAAYASVWSVDEDRRLRREAFAPFDGPLEARTQASEARHFAADFPFQRVVTSGESLLIADLPAELDRIGAAEYAAVSRKFGLKATLFVPLFRGQTVIGALSIARKDESFTPADLVLFDAVGAQAGLTLESARLFADVVQLRDAAQAASMAKDEFLARVSHDLRNPLSAILGWATLLKGGKTTPTQFARGLEVIERSANAQIQLIEDLLDVARIAEGKLQLETSLEPVAPALEMALEPARMAASKKGVSLAVDIDRDVGSVVIDPDRFRQVIWNLASNAVKFTPAGGSIRVRALRAGSMLEVSIADNGQGIPRAFLPRIFAPFEQAGERSSRASGLGLGLAIVRHLVELHGGSISVRSDGDGKGATFTVLLPIRASVVSQERGSGRLDSPPSTRLRGVQILAVDDEDDAREIVSAILEAAGASVVSAASVDEALVRLAAELPHVIVSDINMPGRDGHAFARALRALPPERGGLLPAVALTAMTRARDRIEAIAAGFNTHVPKPVEAEELVMMIVGLLGR